MKSIVLFNDSLQRIEQLIDNEELVNSLIDKNQYDYAIRLFFDYDLASNPILTTFQITKLNGQEKYHYVFRRIDNLEDSVFLIKDLKEMIEIKHIDAFDVAFTNDSLKEYAKIKFGIA